jgi:hypothetical protein
MMEHTVICQNMSVNGLPGLGLFFYHLLGKNNNYPQPWKKGLWRKFGFHFDGYEVYFTTGWSQLSRPRISCQLPLDDQLSQSSMSSVPFSQMISTCGRILNWTVYGYRKRFRVLRDFSFQFEKPGVRKHVSVSLLDFSHFKGKVRRKLRWVKSGINQ